MDWIIDVLVGKIVTAIASVSSIASLILTFVIFLGIRKIKKFYIFTARVPELNNRLNDIASKISLQLTQNTTESTLTREILADAEIVLKSLYKKVSSPLKGQVKKVINEIRSLEERGSIRYRIISFFRNKSRDDQNATQEQQLQNIYISLYRLNGEVKEIYEDSRWEQ